MTRRKSPPDGIKHRRNRKRGDALTRFETKIRRAENGCWEWTGTILRSGYGEFVVGGHEKGLGDLAHRWAWLFYRGALPMGCEIHHECRNRRCVNPDHLRPRTVADHHRQHAIEKGLGVTLGMIQKMKTHCPHGHHYSGENLYLYPNGNRGCRACNRVTSARYEARKRVQNAGG